MLLILVTYVFITETKSYIETDPIITQICKSKTHKVAEFKPHIINMTHNRSRTSTIFKSKEWFIRNA